MRYAAGRVRFFRRRKLEPLCVYCGAPMIEWPRFFTDEFYEAHRCTSECGHFYTSDPRIAELVRGA